jgi:gamma-glutamyltranspeptidase/glutathione hydrolase
MDLQEAIEAPRYSCIHFPNSFYPHDAHPGALRMENRIDAKVRSQLADRGHKVEERPPWCDGNVLAVAFDGSRTLMTGGADPRGQISPLMPAHVIGW